jgi:hypothetical protein
VFVVFAHGIVGRADLPIPTELFGVAAAAALVVSFLALAAGWSRPKLEHVRERALVGLPRVVDVVLGLVGVIAFGASAWAGLAGTDVQADNLAPTAVFVAFWVGVPFLSLLFGDVWRLLSPWRAVGRGVGWVMRRVSGDAMPEPLPYPERLGTWPAVAGLIGFAICELCWATAREPRPLGIIMLAYFAVQLVGMSLYGVEPWTRRADAFGVWFSLLARLAPIGRRADGRLVLRPPVVGAASLVAVAGTAAMLISAIGTTGFDGAKEGPLFNDLAGTLQDFFVSLGTTKGFGLELAFVIGLFLAIGLIGAVWLGGMEGMPRTKLGLDRTGLSRQFAHTLIPIAAGYLVAHYFSLLAYNGQDLWRLASDPLGNGHDYFGGAQSSIDYAVVSATAIWYVQVAALVAGHIAGLVLAHDRALVVYGDARSATRSQIVMLVLMVCFTLLGLWLLSAALNT